MAGNILPNWIEINLRNLALGKNEVRVISLREGSATLSGLVWDSGLATITLVNKWTCPNNIRRSWFVDNEEAIGSASL